ncbi:MAG: hydrogenase formation protein HypD [Candidatus Omnitrophica bacterium]|nr:hydrogenase formation protein HypD [Candidatus Omnitrophota bacterium]
MKYIDEFRRKPLIGKLAGRIRAAAERGRSHSFMEVCGTHTMAIFRFGLRELLPRNIMLTSGPGCPVCVTPDSYIDHAAAIARLPGIIMATFGDMLRVPGTRLSLEKERSRGRVIKTVYSTDDALNIARNNPGKEVVFLGVGFETTVPTVAASIITAAKEGIGNYSVLSTHKTMPEALRALAEDRSIRVDGFILPGHVGVITGSAPYGFLSKKFGIRSVIAGFEPTDILQAILMLLRQKKPRLEVQYSRAIHPGGNALARRITGRVFEPCPSVWRGIGKIEKSGLRIRKKYSRFDAALKFGVKVAPGRVNKDCICGEILKGKKTPYECRLFGRACNPDNPVGACMVSGEGTCAAYYRFGKR